nr:hypothetical protein [Tanacetum cinerariifolium]
MARMDAMAIKMDALYKEFQSRAKQQTPNLDEDDMHMSREEEAKFMQTFRKTYFYNDYHDRDSNRYNWDSSERNNYNRDNYRSNTNDKSYDLQRQFNDFMKSQQSTNTFVKDTFMDLKTQLKTYLVGIAENMLVEVGKFIFPADFVIMEMEEDRKVSLILGRPFLHTANALEMKMMNLSQQESLRVGEYASTIDPMDQEKILERLAGNKYFRFLDGFSGYFQISIDPMDQEKTMFTCPFGTYAYRRMAFGLYNAPTTFQRCMLAIFHDMIEESVEHWKDGHLVLNWEKCHFMVKKRIVLGHKVSGVGLEVDKSKIDVISKLPPLTNIKALKHLFKKQDAKPHLIRWSLLLQEFDIEIKDKKGIENVATDHLSRIGNNKTSDDNEVDDNFPGETLMKINTRDEPLFADFCKLFGRNSYHFRSCHDGPTDRHYGLDTTANKVLDSGFYWSIILKEAHTLVCLCEACQKMVNISKRDEMHLTNIQVCQISIFEMPKALISDRGTYFCNKIMEKTMKIYGVSHRFSTSYHPQKSGQVENTNIALKRVLEKTVKDNPAIWSRKLDDALWAFRTTYKTPTGTTSYKLIYEKNYHLPFEIEHRACWDLKNCNPDLITAGEK